MTKAKPKSIEAKQVASKSQTQKRDLASPEVPTRTSKARASKTSTTKGDGKRPDSKIAIVVSMLRAKAGASVDQLMEATKWQRHSVRGAISGAIKRKLGLKVRVDKTDQGRVYRIVS